MTSTSRDDDTLTPADDFVPAPGQPAPVVGPEPTLHDTTCVVAIYNAHMVVSESWPQGRRTWHLPSGRAESGDTATYVAARTLYEHTGCTVDYHHCHYQGSWAIPGTSGLLYSPRTAHKKIHIYTVTGQFTIGPEMGDHLKWIHFDDIAGAVADDLIPDADSALAALLIATGPAAKSQPADSLKD